MPALQQLPTQSLRCPEYQISAAASQKLVKACDNEQSHVPRNRRVPGSARLPMVLCWAFPACTMLALHAAALAKFTANAFLHAYKRRAVHLLIGHQPWSSNCCPVTISSLFPEDLVVFSPSTPCAGGAAAPGSVPQGKHFDPHTPHWASGRLY